MPRVQPFFTSPGFGALASVIAGDPEKAGAHAYQMARKLQAEAEARKTGVETEGLMAQQRALGSIGDVLRNSVMAPGEDGTFAPRDQAGINAQFPNLVGTMAQAGGANNLNTLGSALGAVLAPYLTPEGLQRSLVGRGVAPTADSAMTPGEGDRISARNAAESQRQAFGVASIGERGAAARNAASIAATNARHAAELGLQERLHYATPVNTAAGAITTFAPGDPRASSGRVVGMDTESTATGRVIGGLADGSIPMSDAIAAIVAPETLVATINQAGENYRQSREPVEVGAGGVAIMPDGTRIEGMPTRATAEGSGISRVLDGSLPMSDTVASILSPSIPVEALRQAGENARHMPTESQVRGAALSRLPPEYQAIAVGPKENEALGHMLVQAHEAGMSPAETYAMSKPAGAAGAPLKVNANEGLDFVDMVHEFADQSAPLDPAAATAVAARAAEIYQTSRNAPAAVQQALAEFASRTERVSGGWFGLGSDKTVLRPPAPAASPAAQEVAPPPAQSGAVAAPQIVRGQTATGPNGQKVVWDGSKWLPVE